MAVRKEPKERCRSRSVFRSFQWMAENNYRWVEAEGEMTFAGEDGQCVPENCG